MTMKRGIEFPGKLLRKILLGLEKEELISYV